jgi:hypothetical protein
MTCCALPSSLGHYLKTHLAALIYEGAVFVLPRYGAPFAEGGALSKLSGASIFCRRTCHYGGIRLSTR